MSGSRSKKSGEPKKKKKVGFWDQMGAGASGRVQGYRTAAKAEKAVKNLKKSKTARKAGMEYYPDKKKGKKK